MERGSELSRVMGGLLPFNSVFLPFYSLDSKTKVQYKFILYCYHFLWEEKGTSHTILRTNNKTMKSQSLLAHRASVPEILGSLPPLNLSFSNCKINSRFSTLTIQVNSKVDIFIAL